MFFSYQILIRKNSSFAVIWRYMHDRQALSKVSKKELLEIDIGQACNDLRNYVPSGKLEPAEVLNKMSLYLLAQLSYGVTLVLNVQADYLIDDLRLLLKSMLRIPLDEREEDEAHKEKKHRKKRKASGAPVPDTMDDFLAQEMDEEEEAALHKKRRTTRLTKPSLLNLSDPRAYVDQQVPGVTPGKQPEEVEHIRELDDMFMDQGESFQMPPPEWPDLAENRPPKVSVAEMMPGPGEESLLSEIVRDITMTTQGEPVTPATETERAIPLATDEEIPPPPPPEEIEPLIPAPEPDLTLEGVREPVYRRTDSMDEEHTRRSFDELRLDTLPELEPIAPGRQPRRRRGKLIIDDRTQISQAEMLRQMADVSDIVRTTEDLRKEREQLALTPLNQLLDPVPRYLINEELKAMFRTVLRPYQERPLTFKEAQRMDDDEFYIRRLDVDLETWHAQTPSLSGESPSAQQQQQQLAEELAPPPPQPEMDEARQQVQPEAEEVRRQKVSVFKHPLVSPRDSENLELEPLEPLRPSTPLGSEPERTRRARDTLQPTRESMAPQSFVEESYVQPMMELEASVAGLEDIQLQRESLLTKTSPDMEEAAWVDSEMDKLYSGILAKQSESTKETPYAYYDEVIEPASLNRKQAARKFFTLLKLLKHGKVKARQTSIYGRIQVRVPLHGFDKSMAEGEEERVQG